MGRDCESSLGQLASFCALALSLIKPGEIVQRGRVGRVVVDQMRVFGDSGRVLFLLDIIECQFRAGGYVLRVGLQPGFQQGFRLGGHAHANVKAGKRGPEAGVGGPHGDRFLKQGHCLFAAPGFLV